MSRWEENPFRAGIVERLEAQERELDLVPLTIGADGRSWEHAPTGREAPPAFLQGRQLVVDVSDRALVLYPLGLRGRYRLRTSLGPGDGERTLVYRPGAAVLRDGLGTTTVRVATRLPVVEIERAGGPPPAPWIADDGEPRDLDEEQWWTPADAGIDDEVARNNSTIPDPLPLEAERAGILARALGNRIVIAAAADRQGAADALEQWEDMRDGDVGYWDAVAARLWIDVPDERLTRQAGFSVHSSLFSRSVDASGRDIFLHGRRDRGYADTAHLHQSYQMHLAALAAGEGASVRDELLAFLALQDPTGWIERAPRPLAGSSVYVGRYTGVHLLLALERYLAWTGDRSLLGEVVVSDLDPRRLSVAERAAMVVADLLRQRFDGLIAPCGWADAWNPEVRAQGQISAAAVSGLRAWARVLRHCGEDTAAQDADRAADSIVERMREVLVDPATGLVAEHVFDDGVTGGSPTDFFAHTQIWAALAGVVNDGRALDEVLRTCVGHGVSIAPASAFDEAYVAASTDSAADLPIESTATWLLADWPEVTHLLALAELERGRPDSALGLVVHQLPETLHGRDPVCAPWYYAEKYLYPGTRPWLCTWAGDPTLIDVLLTGFLGVVAEPGALRIAPRLPASWAGSRAAVGFIWCGRQIQLRLDPGIPSGRVELGGRVVEAGSPIPLAWIPRDGVIRASARVGGAK